MNSSEPTARNLLTAYFNLLQYAPDTYNWSLENFAGDRVRSGYLRQVLALCQAVEIPVKLLTMPDLYAESFFADRPDGWQTALVQEIEAELAQPGQEAISFYERQLGPMVADSQPKPRFWAGLLDNLWGPKAPNHLAKQQERIEQIRGWYLRDFSTIFTQYLRFLGQIQKLSRFNEGWLMASSAGAQFSIKTTTAVIDSLDQQALTRLYEVISRLIDPASRYHSLSELVEHFGFPTENMAKVEADEL